MLKSIYIIISLLYALAPTLTQDYQAAVNTRNNQMQVKAQMIENKTNEKPSSKQGRASIEEQIKAIAEDINFEDVKYLINLAKCESSLNPNVKGRIDKRDRGLWQINSYWHAEVSDDCAYSVDCSTRWTIQRINAGYQYEWVCDKLI